VGRDGKPIRALLKQDTGLDSFSKSSELPRTQLDFEREWRRCCKSTADRYTLILRYTETDLRKVFKMELKSTLLEEILDAISKCWTFSNGSDTGMHTCCRDADDRQQQRNDGSGQVNEADRGDTLTKSELELSKCLSSLRALTGSGRFLLASKLISRRTKHEMRCTFKRMLTVVTAINSKLPVLCPKEVYSLAKTFGLDLEDSLPATAALLDVKDL
jgi:hypothetical protein